MSRSHVVLVILLGVAVVLAAVAIPCRSCDRSASIAVMGLFYYLTLFGLALWTVPGRLLYGGLFAAFGVHLYLVFRMAETTWCFLCILAATNALCLCVVAIISDRRNWAVAGFSLPLSLLAVLILPRPMPVHAALALAESPIPNRSGAVQLLVLERAECPYCTEFRQNHLPRLTACYGDRLEVRFRSADDVPGINRTPTLILSGPRGTRTFEGLPPFDTLARAIDSTSGGRP